MIIGHYVCPLCGPNPGHLFFAANEPTECGICGSEVEFVPHRETEQSEFPFVPNTVKLPHKEYAAP